MVDVRVVEPCMTNKGTANRHSESRHTSTPPLRSRSPRTLNVPRLSHPGPRGEASHLGIYRDTATIP